MEVKRLADQLNRAFSGDAWHGAALSELLRRVAAHQAAAKPIRNAHSIWEIVLHIAVWREVVWKRLRGENVTPTAAEDWPLVTHTSDTAWRETIKRLEKSQTRLIESVAQLDDARLDEIVPSQSYTIYFMLHGVIQHDLYHAGQIALLKKLVED